MRTRISRGLAAALAVSALSLTAACNGSDDPAKDGADKPSAGATGTASAAPTSKAPATPLTAAQMKAAAMELKDLPAGWKVAKTDDDNTNYKADKAECQPLAAVMSADVEGSTLGASADFVLGRQQSELSEEVVTFSGTGAADYTKKLATALDACTDFTVDVEGQKTKFSVRKLTAPQGAEEVLAFGLTMEVAPGIKIEPNLVVGRQGAGVFRMVHLADTTSTKKDFDSFAKLATEKFAKAAQG
ncbi:hypothetical protein ACIGO8_26970 [Streptomyces sp. NPDC053493]|uniref:hypothetical protein n=1 Tax=Streptomyces sp. NPDC053493 TaxID=3365705 RepID=UPI0037D228C6